MYIHMNAGGKQNVGLATDPKKWRSGSFASQAPLMVARHLAIIYPLRHGPIAPLMRTVIHLVMLHLVVLHLVLFHF